MELDRTAQFEEAIHLMNGNSSFVFITGRAGTGKSTLLRYFRETIDLSIPVLAPTGVAALNVDGETIHRFFRFNSGITVKESKKKGIAARSNKLYKNISALIIDEISMVRADLLDCVDAFLRAARSDRRPFGGVRIIAIGDLYQLPPVVTLEDREAFSQLYETAYFFSAKVMQELLVAQAVAFIELEKVYRQTDDVFISILNSIRNKSVTEEQLHNLNRRVQSMTKNSDAIILTPTNGAADAINSERLARLAGKEQVFEAMVSGDFSPSDAPTDTELGLKRGARVMAVVNDPSGHYVNGSLGWIRKISREEVLVEFDDGNKVLVEPHTWTVYRSVYDRGSSQLTHERIGSFTQIPLRLAWAITIHKSQGKTFDSVIIDMGRGAFAAGQTYVALSRCRSLEGLTLLKPLTASQIRLDYAIIKFLTSLQYSLVNERAPLSHKIELLRCAAKTKQKIEIIYLKAKDEKSRRTITPISLQEEEYAGFTFLALRAYCHLRRAERTFNTARILEIREI